MSTGRHRFGDLSEMWRRSKPHERWTVVRDQEVRTEPRERKYLGGDGGRVLVVGEGSWVPRKGIWVICLGES